MSRKGLKLISQVLPKLPALHKPPNYLAWLRYVCEAPENRKTLARIDKAAVDKEVEKLLHATPHVQDTPGCMDQTKSRAAISAWRNYIERIDTKAVPLEISQDVAQLSLPIVARHHRDTRKRGKLTNAWEYQTYAGFAKKAEKQNPVVEFDKTLTGKAFRLAAHNAFLRLDVPTDQKELSRCLGKESEKYWEGRYSVGSIIMDASVEPWRHSLCSTHGGRMSKSMSWREKKRLSTKFYEQSLRKRASSESDMTPSTTSPATL